MLQPEVPDIACIGAVTDEHQRFFLARIKTFSDAHAVSLVHLYDIRRSLDLSLAEGGLRSRLHKFELEADHWRLFSQAWLMAS